MSSSNDFSWPSRLIFGTYKLKGSVLEKSVALALSLGCKDFDTADLYRNATTLQAVLSESPEPTYTTTKIHRAQHPSAFRARIRSSVADLGPPNVVSRVLLHRPIAPVYYSILEEETRAMGVDVGVSNFTADDLRRLCIAYNVPTVNQIEVHPFVPNLLENIAECNRNNVSVEGHTVLGRDQFMSWPPLVEMAREMGATPAQLLLRFAIQTVGENGRVVVQSQNASHLTELIVAASEYGDLKWMLTDAQMGEMRGWSLAKTGAPIRFYIFPPMPPVAKTSTSQDINEYVRDVATRLRNDLDIMEEREMGCRKTLISASIFALPTGFSSRAIKADDLSRTIATYMFPQSKDAIVDYIHAVKRLKDAFLLQQKGLRNKVRSCSLRKSSFHVQIPNDQKKEAEQDEISLVVREPEAMPVMVAPIEELKPFFYYLSSSSPAAIPSSGGALFIRGCLFKDGRMDMCKQVVGSDHITELCDAVKATRSSGKVRHFLLGNNISCHGNPKIGATALASIMKDPELAIETWYLAGNSINSYAMSIIGRALEQSVFVKALWLKRNPIKAAGAVAVGNLLAKSKSLELLDLDMTGLLDEGIENLLIPLLVDDDLDIPLAHLYLGGCGISARGAKTVANFLRSSAGKNLESLYLSMNRIGSEGAQEIASAVRDTALDSRRSKSLKRLSFSSCRITGEALPAIIDAAVACKMVCLDLGWYKATTDLGERPNSLDTTALKDLVQLATCVPSLKYLSVRRCGLKVNEIEELRSAVSNCNERLWLEDGLQNNLTGGQTAAELRNGVRHPKCVENIDSIYRDKM